LSSAQPNWFSPPEWKPAIAWACHAETNAPLGSWNTAILPCPGTSNGGAITVPPAGPTFLAVASASFVPM